MTLLDKWLEPAAITEHIILLNPIHYLPNTCEWLRKNQKFEAWITGNGSPYLWVHGLPGAGKSVLAAKAVSIIHDSLSKMCCYFFCNWGDPTKRSAASIVSTITSQLARRSPQFLAKVTNLRLNGYKLAQSLSLVWQELVLDNLDCVSEELFIVLDGLDECDEKQRQAVIEIIISESPERSRRISWLIFSRYLPEIANFFESKITLEPGDNAEDITAYIEQRVNKSRLLSDHRVRTQVTAALHKEARGIFLWVKLILQELEQQWTLAGVTATLQSLPLGMESLYNRILETLDHVLKDERIRIASAIFGWIACAARPMSVDELTHAVQWSLPDIGELLNLNAIVQKDCGALVSVSTTSLVQFIHHTVHQFVCSGRCSSTLAVDPVRMHEKIATICLSYLLDSPIQANITLSQAKIADNLPLLHYAVLHWVDHIVVADIRGNLLKKLTSFLTSDKLLVAMEATLSIGGVDSLNRWAMQLLKCEVFPRDAPIEFQRFAADLQHFVRHYGHVLNERPYEIHNLINECFPVNSFFWKYFGRNEIRFLSGQCEEWDPCISILDYRHVTCIAVSTKGYFTLADANAVHVIDGCTRIERRRIAGWATPVIAMAVDDRTDILAALTANGSVRLISTTTWDVLRELSQVVQLPSVICEWSWSRFWTLHFLHIDPLHVNFDLTEGTIFAGGSGVDVLDGRLTQNFTRPGMAMTNSVTQFAVGISGLVTSVSADGNVFQRSTGAPSAKLLRKGSESLHSQQNWRLLAASQTGKYTIVCRTLLISDRAMSEDKFKCIVAEEPAKDWAFTFGSTYRISAAAMSSDEILLAVSAHDRMNLLDTTTVWNLNGKSQLIWKSTIFDDHTTSLRFAMDGDLLIKAGRYVRLWDTNLMRKSKSRNVFRSNLAVRLSYDGKYIASVPGEQVMVCHPTLVLQSTERQSIHLEIPWPNALARNVHLKNPISFSTDGQLIVWDQAIFSVRTGLLFCSFPLHEQEKVCHVGGLSYDSSIVVYGTDRRPPRRRRRDIPMEQLDFPQISEVHGDQTQTITAYWFETGERKQIFSASELSVVCTHPTQPVIGFLAQEGHQSWKFYVYSLTTEQCLASAAVPDGSLINASVSAYFSEVSSEFVVTFPRLAWKEGKDFGGAWTDVCIATLPFSTKPFAKMSSEIVEIPNWHICHFLLSGKVLFFLQDGWIALWDKAYGLEQVKYLPPQYQWSISASCTSATEAGGVIRVVIQSLVMGVFWFDICIENLSACTSSGNIIY